MDSPVGGPQKTSIVVVNLDTGEVCVVSSLFSRPETQVIYVDPTTGALWYNGKPGRERDNFKSEREALNYITDGSKWSCRSTIYARAVVGYAALGSFGLLLVATKQNPSIPDFPGGGCVYTVTESQWIKIPLHVLSRPSGFILKPVPSVSANSSDGFSLLSFKRKDITWMI